METPNAAALAGLKRFLDADPPRSITERCGFCDAEVPGDHGHLVDTVQRSLVCVCRACYLLFLPEGAAHGRFRAVPERYLFLDGAGGDAQWDLLDIPVGVAFFFFNSTLNRVAALYPSPAGATESTLPLDAWSEVVAAHPILSSLAPDVEALLVRRTRAVRESFVVPIDACYKLVGIIRQRWKGFDGGEDARQAIDEFFGGIRGKSKAPIAGAAQ